MSRKPLRTVLVVVLLALTGAGMCAAGASAQSPGEGPGGPTLVIANPSNPFSRYYAEILRAEGMNAFAVRDVANVTPAVLGGYDVAILGDFPLTPAEVSMLSEWVTAGGNLVAMRPDKQLAGLLGLTDAGATLANAYMRVDGSRPPGAGIVSETMQFHGTADRYALSGASSVASLYSSASAATTAPAVTLRSVGSAGGQAAAFTYDLAKSVVQTRQGNPAWAEQDRDGSAPIRSNDLFFGAASFDPQPNWVDLSKVAIPQADEQQRLLVNLIGQLTADKKPLPRFWYFPRGAKAAVIMTGDDHADGGTAGRFNQYLAASPAGCVVAEWECIRGTSYVYPNSPLTDAQAASFTAQGFEVALHVRTPSLAAPECDNYTQAEYNQFVANQLVSFKAKYQSVPAPVSNRNHCIAFSDWSSTPKVELANGIRLDTNYYYFGPPGWVNNTPGMFTGSGMPMRFADTDGALIDVYQAATQMTDESGQTYPFTVDTLLGRALGAEGYYGAFTANMHTDQVNSAGSDAIVASARARGVPVVTSKQMLTWLDRRNGSTFESIAWAGDVLSFRVAVGAGANGLRAMLPATFGGKALHAMTRDGAALPYTRETIKGVEYAFFAAGASAYTATYGTPDTTPPETTIVEGSIGAGTARFTFSSNESARFECRLDASAFGACATPAQYSGLANGAHAFSVRAIDPSGNVDATPASRVFTTTGAPSGGPVLGGSAVRITVSKRSIRASRKGIVRLRVKCPSTEVSCRLDIRLRRNGRDLGRKKATIAGGKTATVKVRLTRNARDRLARKGRLRVKAVIRATDIDLNRAITTTKIKLLAPGRR